jgi:hypothetical protein
VLEGAPHNCGPLCVPSPRKSRKDVPLGHTAMWAIDEVEDQSNHLPGPLDKA